MCRVASRANCCSICGGLHGASNDRTAGRMVGVSAKLFRKEVIEELATSTMTPPHGHATPHSPCRRSTAPHATRHSAHGRTRTTRCTLTLSLSLSLSLSTLYSILCLYQSAQPAAARSGKAATVRHHESRDTHQDSLKQTAHVRSRVKRMHGSAHATAHTSLRASRSLVIGIGSSLQLRRNGAKCSHHSCASCRATMRIVQPSPERR